MPIKFIHIINTPQEENKEIEDEGEILTHVWLLTDIKDEEEFI